MRIVTGIQHPLWNRTDRVMDRVLAEFDDGRRPAWCEPIPEARVGIGLAQLFCRAVDDECGICFEDPGR